MMAFEFHQKEVLWFAYGSFSTEPGCQWIINCYYLEIDPSVGLSSLKSVRRCEVQGLWAMSHHLQMLMSNSAYVLPAAVLSRGINILISPLEGAVTSRWEKFFWRQVQKESVAMVVITLTAGVQHACVFPGHHVILSCDSYVFISVQDSGR